MNGIKYLPDTNIIIGLLKGRTEAVKILEGINITECAYSAVTRMELLSFHGITTEEETAIQKLLERMTHLSITSAIEDAAIKIRRKHRLKLPDAIIAATAKIHGLTLLTLDKALTAWAILDKQLTVPYHFNLNP
jgi:predicted nucleic acid-binding protein